MKQQIIETTENMVSVYVMPIAWAKMRRIVDTCPLEANWYGIVQRLNNCTFLIKDIYIAKQEVTGISVDITPEDYMSFLRDLNARGIIDLNDDEKGETEGLYFQGHSHVNMGVSPSLIDEEARTATIEKNVPFYIWIIMNKQGEHSCCVYVNMVDIEGNKVHPMEGILFRKLQAQLYYDKPEEAMADIDRQIKENIHERKAETTTVSKTEKSYKGYGFLENDPYDYEYTDYGLFSKNIETAEDGVPEIVDGLDKVQSKKTSEDILEETGKTDVKPVTGKEFEDLCKLAKKGKLMLYQVRDLFAAGLITNNMQSYLEGTIRAKYDAKMFKTAPKSKVAAVKM